MIRSSALGIAVLLAACSATPAPTPSASALPTPTIAAASPTLTPPVTPAAPSPSPVRTPISLPNTALIDAPSGPTVWVLVGLQAQGARLFRSIDRGDTWDERALPEIAPILLSFIDGREGWAMGDTRLIPAPPGAQCGSPVALAHTSDTGTSWQTVTTTGLEPPGPCKSSFTFADAQHGFIAATDPAGSPLVYRTADGGRSWAASSRLADPPGFTSGQGPYLGVGRIGSFGTTVLLTVSPNNPFTGASFIYRSTDGGATWTYASKAPNSAQDIAFVTATRWLQISSPGDSRETTDGGATWHAFATQYQQAAPVGPAVVFGDAQVGYATARGAIQRTIDGGVTWTTIKTPGTF